MKNLQFRNYENDNSIIGLTILCYILHRIYKNKITIKGHIQFSVEVRREAGTHTDSPYKDNQKQLINI